jgi:hypothetical protein
LESFAMFGSIRSAMPLWEQGVENPEVRELLLQIMAAGKLGGCADIAYAVAMDGNRTIRERSLALRALLELNDPRLEALAASVESDPGRWPDGVARLSRELGGAAKLMVKGLDLRPRLGPEKGRNAQPRSAS